MANLGFVGLGVMGGQMVSRLLDKGHTVTGYNRTKSKAQWLIDKGMKWADSPRAVAAAADVTLLHGDKCCGAAAVPTVRMALLAGIGAGKTSIDMSTVSPAVSRACCRKCRARQAPTWSTRQSPAA